MIILVLLFLTTINTKTAQVPRGYVSNFTSPYPDPDFPGWTPSIESLSGCSYIIPMDFAYQGCDNPDEPEVGRINSACDICHVDAPYTCAVFTNPDFNLFAYGLVNHLLWSDIPVKWIIKTNKQHNDYDIVNAQTVIVYPSRLANLSNIEASAKPRNFSGGPFAIETQFTHYADPFIANYTLTVGEVRVFMTSEIINVDVRYTLLTRPYVAVLASSNEQFVSEAALMSAGFQQGLHWEEMTRDEARDTLGNGTCVTIAIESHFHSCADQDPSSSYTSNSAAFVSAARAVLNMGSNFYAMCGGINTYEQCDNEDGTSCSLCSELNPDATGCVNCQEDNSYPLPCRNGDVFNQRCVNVTVGNTPFGGYRQHALCQTGEPGYFYGRYNPVLTNRYCPEGFFMTENVANSSYGGFHTPSYYLTQINNHMIFHNMAPDIPFNQWLGDWDYETNSSVRYLSLWNSLVDSIPLNQQTKLRTSTWAHFTIAEENNARDNIVKVGYPYGIYYAAHAKLSQFQGGKGGNIFYLAGHYYAADNREIAQAGYILSNSTEAFGGSACVDAGVANSYGLNGQLMSGPATSLGGGCFNRPGRRMLLNAVMTPSNLTCNPSRTVCSDGACYTGYISLQVDPCKAFGVCGGSGFKRNINIVSSTPGGNGQSCIVVNTSNSSLSVPSATSNNSLSVPSATSNNSHSVPSATSNNSLSVPSATSNNSLSVPSATSNNPPSVPPATSNNPPSVPSATSNNPPSVPSATSNNPPSVPSATSNNPPSIPSSTSNNPPSVPSATSNNSHLVPPAMLNNSLSVLPTTTTSVSIIAIIVPILVVVIIVVMVIFFVRHKREINNDVELNNLGSFVNFLPWLGKSKSIVWEKTSQEPVYYFSNLEISSIAYKATSDLFYNVLNGNKLKIETIFAIYNPNLHQAFNCYKLNLKNRYTNSPSLFLKDWEHSDPEINKLRARVHNDFQKYVQKFEWNAVDDQLPIIPVVHGTDEDIGWQICNSGFAALATLDSGYYGRGIYFSTHALYTLPYFATKKNPTILICFVLPGNMFPVTESHLDSEVSLMGTPIKSGFQSHYVLVRKDGKVCTEEETNVYFNELVIDQEAQILPGFLIVISKSNLSEVVRQFEEIASRSLPLSVCVQ